VNLINLTQIVCLFNLDETCETRTQFWMNLTQKQEWMERKGTSHYLIQDTDKSLKMKITTRKDSW